MRMRFGALRKLLWEAYEKESYRRQLNAIIERHAGPHVYLRFDDREAFSKARSFRLDMNSNDHTNHAGVWTYMIEPGSEFLHEGTFGSSSQWVTILRAKRPNRIVRSDVYSEADLKHDLERLSQRVSRDRLAIALDAHESRKAMYLEKLRSGDMNDLPEDLLSDWIRQAEEPSTAFEKLDSLAIKFGQSNDHRDRQRQFYLELGYLGIEDPVGVIDTNGWTAVHFDPRNIKIIKRYRLQDAFDPKQYDQEEEEYQRSKGPRFGHNPPDDLDPDNPGNWRDNDGDVDPPYEKGFYYDRAGVKKSDPRYRD